MSEIKFKIGDEITVDMDVSHDDLTKDKVYIIVDVDKHQITFIDDVGDENTFNSIDVSLLVKERSFPRMMLVRDYEAENWIQKEVHAIILTMDYPYITNEDISCNWKYGKEIEEITGISKTEAEKMISKIQGKTVKITN